ncbi:hypothetical protein SAMN04515620_11269 [Collimonas sp. OK607]|uniref:PqiC family protein n=1 Tax=Collimonas sp. OK607 TaxID=1798194 RepID=UPI0008E4226B|nr:PqiC family protein [Collimonas sp. OK607]SFB01301.1 hypothetical protein SAMN04515620_11269 [Collimonas sp. OK607]
MTTTVSLSVLSAQLVLVTAMLAGCVSPEPRYYTLSQRPIIAATAAPAAKQGQEPVLIEVSPVRVPDRLNRANLLLNRGDSRLKVMEQDRWSAPFPDELRDALSQHLQASLNAVDIYHQGTSGNAPLYRVTVEVVRMDAELGGRADAIINWTVQRLPDSKVTSGRTQVELPTPGGLDSVVAAYQHIVIAAAADIATAIRTSQKISLISSETGNSLTRYNQYHVFPEKQEIS